MAETKKPVPKETEAKKLPMPEPKKAPEEKPKKAARGLTVTQAPMDPTDQLVGYDLDFGDAKSYKLDPLAFGRSAIHDVATVGSDEHVAVWDGERLTVCKVGVVEKGDELPDKLRVYVIGPPA